MSSAVDDCENVTIPLTPFWTFSLYVDHPRRSFRKVGIVEANKDIRAFGAACVELYPIGKIRAAAFYHPSLDLFTLNQIRAALIANLAWRLNKLSIKHRERAFVR